MPFHQKDTIKCSSNISLTVPLQSNRTCAACITRRKELTILIPNGSKKTPIISLGLSVICKLQIKALGWLANRLPCLQVMPFLTNTTLQ